VQYVRTPEHFWPVRRHVSMPHFELQDEEK
jgi:hypothetical protein